MGAGRGGLRAPSSFCIIVRMSFRRHCESCPGRVAHDSGWVLEAPVLGERGYFFERGKPASGSWNFGRGFPWGYSLILKALGDSSRVLRKMEPVGDSIWTNGLGSRDRSVI